MAFRYFSEIILRMFERRRSAKGHVRPAQKLLLNSSEVITASSEVIMLLPDNGRAGSFVAKRILGTRADSLF